MVTFANYGYSVYRFFDFLAPKMFLNCLSFQTCDFEHTRWRLLQKHILYTILDIYDFIWKKLLPGISSHAGLVWFMVFNTSFNNISVLSLRSILLVEETGVSGENHRLVGSHWQTLSHNGVPSHEQGANSQL